MESENDNGEMPVKAEINQNVLKRSMRSTVRRRAGAEIVTRYIV
jgi:hypothetical protein